MENQVKNICPQGHDLTNPDNIYLQKGKYRSCKVCILLNKKRYYIEKKEAGLYVPPSRNPINPRIFWSKVDQTREHWEWKGYYSPRDNRAKYNGRDAAKTAYILTYGEVPTNRVVTQVCRVNSCVNPQHLKAVERPVALAGRRKPRVTKTQCKWGHNFDDPSNIYIEPKTGHLSCRACRSLRQSEAPKVGRKKIAKGRGDIIRLWLLKLALELPAPSGSPRNGSKPSQNPSVQSVAKQPSI